MPKAKYWKYAITVACERTEVHVIRVLVEGNNVRYLKPPKKKENQRVEIVERIVLDELFPLKEYEKQRTRFDSTAFQSSDRFETYTVMVKRLDKELIDEYKAKYLTKYPEILSITT